MTVCAGVVTNFIGATFMAMYKASIGQTEQHFSALERINAVGMCMKVLDKIGKSESKDKAMIEIANKVLSMYDTRVNYKNDENGLKKS